jgi:hypothetical protein
MHSQKGILTTADIDAEYDEKSDDRYHSAYMMAMVNNT